MELETNPRMYARCRFPYLSKPNIVGYYSLDSDRNYHGDASQMKFMSNLPNGNVCYNLNHNSENTKKRKEETVYLENMLHFIKDHSDRNLLDLWDMSKISLHDVPFVCFRGFLREISAIPYTHNDPFKAAVCLFRGVIYMHTMETPEAKIMKDNQTLREKTMCSWGYKFEQYMVSDTVNGKPNIESPTDENTEFGCIYKARLEKHHIMYGAEMDAILPNGDRDTSIYDSLNGTKQELLEEIKNCKFVELKTSRIITNEKQKHTFRRHKTLAWWLQSFFVAIDDIVCGYRDDDGIVRNLRSHKTKQLAEDGSSFWSANVCLTFCNLTLEYVKRCLASEIHSRGWKGGVQDVRHHPPLCLILNRQPRSNMTYELPKDPQDTIILAEWFTKMFENTS